MPHSSFDRTQNSSFECYTTAQLDLLDLVGVLVLLAFFVPFGLFVAEFAKIHQTAYERRGVGRDLDQVQPLAHRQAQRFIERHHAELLLLLVEYAHLAGANLPISAVQGFPGVTRARGKGVAQGSLPGWNLFMWLWSAKLAVTIRLITITASIWHVSGGWQV
jgi:hypothetical protein